jgi:hypothetical protein
LPEHRAAAELRAAAGCLSVCDNQAHLVRAAALPVRTCTVVAARAAARVMVGSCHPDHLHRAPARPARVRLTSVFDPLITAVPHLAAQYGHCRQLNRRAMFTRHAGGRTGPAHRLHRCRIVQAALPRNMRSAQYVTDDIATG